jgi:sigma-E factor negative regulatory protein RseC
MQNPQGRILSVSGADPLSAVVVEIETSVACQRCASGKGCGAGLLGGRAKDRQIEATVSSGLRVKSGDSVSVQLEPSNVLQAAIIVYGYPLASAVLAALAAMTLGLGDVASAVFALTGIGTGFLMARRRLRSAQCLRDFTPVVVENLTAVH